MCTRTSLVMCDGAKKSTIFPVNAQTKVDKGLEIAHIDNVYSQKGILLPAGKHYELDATYDNVTQQAQDSMMVEGIFFEDNKFVKPVWKDEPQIAQIKLAPHVSSPADYEGYDRYAVFDSMKDGPVLSSEKRLELQTSAGKIHLVIDPSFAPQNATQMYKLFKAGAFDGTTVLHYQPDFLLQIASADLKHNPNGKSTDRESSFSGH